MAKADEHLLSARAAFAAKDLASAEKQTLAGLALDAGNPYLLNVLAACRYSLGDVPSCLSAMRRACDSDKKNFRLHYDLAVFERRHGEPALADAAARVARAAADGPEQVAQIEALLAGESAR